MGGTTVRCGKCEGRGVLLINVSADGEGSSYIETPCKHCNGTGRISRAELMSRQADYTLEPDDLMVLAMTGALRTVINGDIYQRKMTSRELYKLASYALMSAMETDKYEKEKEYDANNSRQEPRIYKAT